MSSELPAATTGACVVEEVGVVTIDTTGFEGVIKVEAHGRVEASERAEDTVWRVSGGSGLLSDTGSLPAAVDKDMLRDGGGVCVLAVLGADSIVCVPSDSPALLAVVDTTGPTGSRVGTVSRNLSGYLLSDIVTLLGAEDTIVPTERGGRCVHTELTPASGGCLTTVLIIAVWGTKVDVLCVSSAMHSDS